MCPYNETGGNKDWGLMRRDFTVKPGYAAFATLVDQLGNAAPEGEVRLGDGLKGFLYRRKEGGKVLAYWCISELDTDKPRPGLSNAERSGRHAVHGGGRTYSGDALSGFSDGG